MPESRPTHFSWHQESCGSGWSALRRLATVDTKNPYMYREDRFFVARSRISTIAAAWHRVMSPGRRDFHRHDLGSIMANRRLWKTGVWTPNGLHVDSDY